MVFLHTLTRGATLFSRHLPHRSSRFSTSFYTGLHQLQRTNDVTTQNFKSLPFNLYPSILLPCLFYTTARESVESPHKQIDLACNGDETKDSADVFREWGCSESDITTIFGRCPSLRNTNIQILQTKLEILSQMDIESADLVKMILCRPRFLNFKANVWLKERLEYMEALFGSREILVKSIVRNPSLLTYDFHNKIKPVIAMYESLGITNQDLITMLQSRPTMILRSNLDDEKINYIRRTGVPKESKMYKHVVCLFAISRIETIREKLMNMERYGISEDEFLGLIGRSPLVLTLSTEKVQRNMTFILGAMKLPASAVLHKPYLIFFNLETVLKPRFQIACKIEDMGLVPQIKGRILLRAFRMSDKRFVSAFITCHPPEVAAELITAYEAAKSVRRLAESSKKNHSRGFPF
ncbi:hypothetical protein ACS0TY_005137 [Phlomoides rotata]